MRSSGYRMSFVWAICGVLWAPGAHAEEASTARAGANAGGSSSPPATAASASASKDTDGTPPDDAHFRFGFGLDGSFLTGGDLSGAALGLQLRLGAQINQWSAVYYQGHGLLGGVVGGTSGGGLLGAGFNSLMGELTLPVVHIGAGPSLDYIGIASCGSSTGGCDSDSGAHFGIDGRVAIVIGGHGPGHHGGFAINFNVHPTFVSGSVLTTLSAGLGGEFY